MKILIAGYPKSGNTWINYLVAYGTGATYTDFDDPENSPKNPYVLGLVSGHSNHKFKSPYTDVYKTHRTLTVDETEQYEKIIYIVRDPRDVSISFFYFKYYLQALKQGRKPINERYRMHLLNRLSVWFYMKKTWLKTSIEWVKHIGSWKTHTKLTVRYEDLRNNGEQTLSAIFAYLKVDRTRDEIREIYDSLAFEKLSQDSPSNKKAPQFYRKGITGDFRNHFSFLDNLIYLAIFGRELKRNKFHE